ELLDPIIVPDHNYLFSCAESQQGAVVQARDATSALADSGRQDGRKRARRHGNLGGYELGNLGNALRAMPTGTPERTRASTLLTGAAIHWRSVRHTVGCILAQHLVPIEAQATTAMPAASSALEQQDGH